MSSITASSYFYSTECKYHSMNLQNALKVFQQYWQNTWQLKQTSFATINVIISLLFGFVIKKKFNIKGMHKQQFFAKKNLFVFSWAWRREVGIKWKEFLQNNCFQYSIIHSVSDKANWITQPYSLFI